jgi:hypothetical protein
MADPDSESENISGDDLQDLAIVAVATSLPEAMFLTGILEDAGIPAATRSDSVWGLAGGPGDVRVVVPRKMLERARLEIEQARSQAEQRRVEDAFSAQTVADRTYEATKDPLLEKMFLIRDSADEAERNLKLEPYAAKWLTDGTRPVDIAKYLGAAGLSIQEAESFLEAMKAKYAGEIDADRDRRKVQGVALLIVGLFLTLGSVVAFGMTGRGELVVTYGALIFGLIYYHQSTKPLPSIKASPTSQDEKPT